MEKQKKVSKIHTFLKYIEKTFMPIIGKIGSNRYIEAIRNGMVSIIPILLIGSTFLIIFFFPIGKSETFGINYLMKVDNGRWAAFMMLPYRLTYPMLGFFAVIGISRSLSKHYKLDDQQGVFIAIIAYLISIVGPTYTSIGNPSFTTASFSSTTVFGGIIISIISVDVFKFCINKKIMIRLPQSVPQVVAKPFNALIPMLVVMIPSILIFNVAKFDIHKYANYVLQPLQSFFGGNNYFGFITVVFLIMILWIAGIHGVAVIGSLARPFWLIALSKNTNIVNSGQLGQLYANHPGANILVEPFFQWFVWIGGAGATLGLIIIMLIIAKSKYIRAVTYPSILPGIFNINEPIIFGYPLVLNPILAIPAILVPITNGTIAFICMKLNWVPVPINIVGWTLPSFVGGLLSTGLSWQACVLTFVLLAVSTLIWWPFAKVYDNMMLNEEIENEIIERIEVLKKENAEYDPVEIRALVEKELRSRSIFKRNKKAKAKS